MTFTHGLIIGFLLPFVIVGLGLSIFCNAVNIPKFFYRTRIHQYFLAKKLEDKNVKTIINFYRGGYLSDKYFRKLASKHYSEDKIQEIINDKEDNNERIKEVCRSIREKMNTK